MEPRKNALSRRLSLAQVTAAADGLSSANSPGGDGATSMAQRDGGDDLADRLGGLNLESVSAGEGKSTIGPAGLIHKVTSV